MFRGVKEHRDVIRPDALAPKLLAEAGGVRGDRLLQAGQVLDAAGEHARDGTALPARRNRLQVEAGHAAQLVDRALAGPTPQFSAGAIRTSQCARSASFERSHTPSSGGQLLAMWLASFASVLVGPMP